MLTKAERCKKKEKLESIRRNTTDLAALLMIILVYERREAENDIKIPKFMESTMPVHVNIRKLTLGTYTYLAPLVSVGSAVLKYCFCCCYVITNLSNGHLWATPGKQHL